ncbi:ATP-binding protein [Embleya sp. NPDC008237]|uniref:ATP-binding protein n=1 Tax=Embleya sp. NPDC008237 TaxID=3363978 RepID=UPI0036E3707E
MSTSILKGCVPIASLTCTADAPYAPAVRGVVVAALTRLGIADEELLRLGELLTTEVFANAVRHAPRTRVRVRVSYDRPGARIVVDVEDGSRALPARTGLPMGGLADHGRGVPLLEELSQAHGCKPLVRGKRIWFALRVPQADPVRCLRAGRAAEDLDRD